MDNSDVQSSKEQVREEIRKEKKQKREQGASLKLCPDCRSDISKNASHCPSCGCRFQVESSGFLRIMFSIAVVLLAVATIAAAGLASAWFFPAFREAESAIQQAAAAAIYAAVCVGPYVITRCIWMIREVTTGGQS
jgi:hypothetical protein